MNGENDDRIRFSLRSMFCLTGFAALILGIVSSTGSIVLGAHLSLGLIGWVMWRIVRVHPGGLIPFLLGADLLACSSIDWVVRASEGGFLIPVWAVFSVPGSLLVLIGFGVLLAIGLKKRHLGKRQTVAALIILPMLLAWWIVIPMLGHAAVERRRASDAAAMTRAAAEAIAMVEEVRLRTGTTPDDEALAALLPKPLPRVRWGEVSGPIRYRRTGDKTYELSYIDPAWMFGDIVVYDSSTPQKGWVRIPW